MNSISYDVILDRFQSLGKFSRNFPDLCTDSVLSEIERNIYLDILDGCKRNVLSRTGKMVSIQYEYDTIIVHTFYKSGSIHVRSIHITHAQFDALKAHFQAYATLYPITVIEEHTLSSEPVEFVICAKGGASVT